MHPRSPRAVQDQGVIEVPSGITNLKCTIQWVTAAGDEVSPIRGEAQGLDMRNVSFREPRTHQRAHEPPPPPPPPPSPPPPPTWQILCATAQWSVSLAAATAPQANAALPQANAVPALARAIGN